MASLKSALHGLQNKTETNDIVLVCFVLVWRKNVTLATLGTNLNQ